MYKVILSIHIIAVISWMAGLLYLFRLFVYHASETENVVKQRFEVMEKKLYSIITVPAMLVALLMGLVMLYLQPSLLSQGWLHTKLLLVFFLIGITHMGGSYLKKFARGAHTPTHKAFRFLNEVPTLLMIGIVFLAILKPF